MRENDWRSLPVIPLQGDQRICVDFDCFDTNFHRFLYKIEHCEADWTVSEGLFTTDIANGFLEDLEIPHIAPSVNTTIPYTHYRSEEHTSELQSRQYLLCRFLLEKKKSNVCPGF